MHILCTSCVRAASSLSNEDNVIAFAFASITRPRGGLPALLFSPHPRRRRKHSRQPDEGSLSILFGTTSGIDALILAAEHYNRVRAHIPRLVAVHGSCHHCLRDRGIHRSTSLCYCAAGGWLNSVLRRQVRLYSFPAFLSFCGFALLLRSVSLEVAGTPPL
jgi:hypothetical protein